MKNVHTNSLNNQDKTDLAILLNCFQKM